MLGNLSYNLLSLKNMTKQRPFDLCRLDVPSDQYLMDIDPRVFAICMVTSSNGNIFRVAGLLCGEFTSHRLIPHTKASDAEL